MASILFLLCTFFISSTKASEIGASCSISPLGVAIHGEAKNINQNPPPYKFQFTDSFGRGTNEYTEDVYTVRLSGDVPFRGFSIHARVATPQGFLIGVLKAGHFIPEPQWEYRGIEIDQCLPIGNTSITNSNDEEKYSLEAKWQTLTKEGPIQFVITIVQSEDTYWSQWQPPSGLIIPSKNGKFISQHSNREEIVDKENFSHQSPFFGDADFKSDYENNEKDAKSKFRLVPRFNISLAGGNRFSIRVINSDKDKKKEENEFPMPPEFHMDNKESNVRFPEPPKFNLEGELESENNGVQIEATILPILDASTTFDKRIEPIQEFIECKINFCSNNATCRFFPKEKRYECLCLDGWTGENCSEHNFCFGHKCRNNALCIGNATTETYTCQCVGEWAGEFCERSCPSYLCQNGGNCTISKEGQFPNGYGCDCPLGYSGKSCEINTDDCAGNPCQHGATCIDKLNDYECLCAPGYMGEKCHRPCQDIYKSCEFWGEQDRCDNMRPTTKFYDVNCAVTCGQCQYDNLTVNATNNFPLPPILEPFAFIMGKWIVNTTRPYRFPLDFTNAEAGYYETLEITTSALMQFGTPSINFSAKAYNNLDPSDQQITVGFLTLSPAGKPYKVSIMSTGNAGMTILEEGEMEDSKLDLEMVYIASSPGLDSIAPTFVKRKFSFRPPYLQESVERLGAKGQKDYFTKYFSPESRFSFTY